MIILTEKPSVAAAFADALGVPRTKDGFWENSGYCIVNALGHLLEIFEPHDYDPAFKKWDLAALPIIPSPFRYKPVDKTKSQLALVTRCLRARKADGLLLATDAEREGELIGDEILQYAGFRGFANARRFWVSEALTRDVILHGIETARPLAGYVSYKEQGYARQQADWLVGINLSRLISLKTGLPLSFGRVQTAVLAALYDRENDIASFVKEKYLELTATLKADRPFSVKLVNSGNSEFPTRFPEHSPAFLEIAEKLAPAKTGVVTSLVSEKKTEHPPRLFNITALQKAAHKKFSYTPEKTLEIAQALYEKHRCLSYPRTPSRVMGDDNVGLVTSVFDSLKDAYPEPAAAADPALIASSNKRVFNSAQLRDHHALIPLAPLPVGASAEEANVFSLVLSRFFTAFMPPCVYNSITIDVDISGFLFKGSGIEVLKPGWKASAAGDGDGENPDEKNNYSGLTRGAAYPVLSLTPEEKFTRPKKHFTYASLLALMENPREDGRQLSGLGTPATRGAILKKLADKKYIAEIDKNILISDEGKYLVEVVRENKDLADFISIPETTRWEEALHASTDAFLEDIKAFVSRAVKNTAVEPPRQKSLGSCPLCGGQVIPDRFSFHCERHRDRLCSFSIGRSICGAPVSEEDISALLSGGKSALKSMKSKSGKPFKAYLSLDKNSKIIFEFKDQGGKK
jgi:DNA topoisomerase-3